jgi:hypothetical protein
MRMSDLGLIGRTLIGVGAVILVSCFLVSLLLSVVLFLIRK